MTVPGWAPMALAGVLALVVAGVIVLVATAGERKEGAVGQHSWINGRRAAEDDELLAAVTGLGPERDTGPQAWVAAAELSTEGWDLRGVRDDDPSTSNPWREQ